MTPSSLLFPDWPAPSHVRAATTLRCGGVSQGVYAGLNIALHVGDDEAHVRHNRQIVKEWLKLPAEPSWLEQVHGNRVVKVSANGTIERADAAYSTETGIVCAVMTADCLPLLMCSTDGKQIAAVHAGWRGLLAGIIEQAVAALDQRDVLVWLGPAIGPECFEVGNDVRDAFVHKAAIYVDAFRPAGQDKWLADIYRLARIELLGLGIRRIYGGDFCTYSNADSFYSYRRENRTGRMATLIWRE